MSTSEDVKVSADTLEYYCLARAAKDLVGKHAAGDSDVVSELGSLDNRLCNLYAGSMARPERILFLHHLLMLLGGQVILNKLGYKEWYAAAGAFHNLDYGGSNESR